MKLQFDANQEYQIAAIKAVADLFDGQPRVDAAMDFSLSAGFAAIANRLDLSEGALLRNLAAVQQENDVPPDETLQWITDEVNTSDGAVQVRFANFSVEMETGTGKTYVYIRTALELFQRYGFRKFIIVVPSVAVREGVLKPEFKELWERIRHKTKYAVKIDTEKLIADVVDMLDQTNVHAPEIAVSTARIQVDGAKDELQAIKIGEKHGHWPHEPTKRQTNIVELMSDLMQRTSPPMRLTRRTLLEIFRRTRKRDVAARNPHELATVAVQIVKHKLMDQLVNGIQYERIDDWYRMEQFESEIESWEEYAVPADRSLYDRVLSDSDVEKQFVNDMERRDDVKLYIKLPGWFAVQTPVGQYNPDWAVVIEPRDEFGNPTNEEMLYLVGETKGTTDRDKLRPDEQRRILCGERHFEDALNVPYKVVANAAQL